MISQRLVEKALRTAQAAQVEVVQSEATQVGFESDRLKASAVAQETLVEVKVIVDGLMGQSTTTDIADLDGVVQRALETAQFGKPAHAGFPAPQDPAAVQIHDEELLSLQPLEMIAAGEEMIALLKAYNPDILVEAEVAKTAGRREFANSKGASFTLETTRLTSGVTGTLIRGTDVFEVGHWRGERQRYDDHITSAQTAIEWFRMAEQPATVSSGQLPVIFSPWGTVVLYLTLWMAMDGKNVLLGASPWGDKLGQPVVAPSFSLVDDPLVDFGPTSGPYDGEGVARRRLPFIENGVLRRFIYDMDTAAQAGAESTGHGPSRRLAQPHILPGDSSLEAMIASIDEGLLVHEMLGVGQGNPVSGQFSVNVHTGFKIEKGEIVGRVKDVMLAGNVYDALNDIVAIGDTPEWVFSYFVGKAPYLQIGNLSVIAG